MTLSIEEILHNLNHFESPLTDILIASTEQKEALTPHLLKILEQTISYPEQVDANQMDYILGLYLLSKFRETKAYPLVIALASLPDGIPEVLLGDYITEALARFIVSTFNGDIQAIKNLIENEKANIWSRNEGLKSLVGLVALDQFKREELIDYLRNLFHSPLSQGEEFVTHLVNRAADLYPEELLPEINQAFKENKVDTYSVDQKWINRVLAQGKEQCLLTFVYKNQFHLPIDDIEEDTKWMQGFHQSDNLIEPTIFEEDDDFKRKFIFNINPTEAYAREMVKVGRNESCPCGSGKKFKKCCLA